MVVDIPQRANNANSDGFRMRRCAAECSIPMMTSLDTVGALIEVMEENLNFDNTEVIELNEIK